MITTTLGDRDEAQLLRETGGLDNAVETTTWVEYCLSDCGGAAHRTRVPDAPGVFCAQHIHRSVAMHLKTGVFAAGVAADFG